MKIFNWLQNKLYRNADYKMLSLEQEMKSTEHDRDEEALLEQATLTDMMDGWHDGILTIGTFGLDQLAPSSFTEDEYSIHGGEYSAEEEEDGEDSFIALEAFERELEALKDSLSGIYDDEMTKCCPLNDGVGDDTLHSFSGAEKKRKKGRRTTLADLFLADSDAAATKSSSGDVADSFEKKLASRSKFSPSLAKRLVPWKWEDSRPSMKLRRMITRMLKKKIHPEIGRDSLVADRAINSALVGPARRDSRFKQSQFWGNKQQENESISLLQDVALEG